MKIALAGARVRNNDLPYNLTRMQHWMKHAKCAGADLVCFGEAYLQGFDAFSWTYETDRNIAVSVQDDVFAQLKEESRQLGIDLMFGFLERDGEKLYCSCALIEQGVLTQLYRRVSVGWKEYTRTDGHYCEGDTVQPFLYRGKKCVIALCGDLWDDTAEMFKQGQDITFWPMCISYSLAQWLEEGERAAYAERAGEFGGDVLLINAMDDIPPEEGGSQGGCCHFAKGGVQAEHPMGSEGMLLVHIV